MADDDRRIVVNERLAETEPARSMLLREGYILFTVGDHGSSSSDTSGASRPVIDEDAEVSAALLMEESDSIEELHTLRDLYLNDFNRLPQPAPSAQTQAHLDSHAKAPENVSGTPPHQQTQQQTVPGRLQEWFDTVINPIRVELGDSKNEQFPIPAIIVFGSEDSGKSSLLNALIGVELLPSNTGVCTRLPIEIQMRQGEISVECYNSATHQLIDRTEAPTQAWLADVLSSANSSVGDQISASNSVLIRVTQPNIVTLDFIDLPGLMSVAREGFPPDSPQVTRARTVEFLQRRRNNAIMLLVCDAATPVIQTVGMQIVQELRLEQQTIAVLTRSDRVNQRFLDESVVATLEGRRDAAVVHLTHGYYATTLQAEGRPLSVEEEVDWFIQQDAYSQQTLQRTGRINLMNAIQGIFNNFIRSQWIPRNRLALQEKIRQLRADYRNLGSPVPANEEPNADLGIQIEGLPEADLVKRVHQVFHTNLEESFQIHSLQSRVRNALSAHLVGNGSLANSEQGMLTITKLRTLHQQLSADTNAHFSVSDPSLQLEDSIIDRVVKPLGSEILRDLRKRLEEESSLKINTFTAVESLLGNVQQAIIISRDSLRQRLKLLLRNVPLCESFLVDFARNQSTWISNLVLGALAAPLDAPQPLLDLRERKEVADQREKIRKSLLRCLNLETTMRRAIGE